MAAQRLKELEAEKKILGFCVGISNYDRNEMLKIFDPNRILELENLNFPALFKYVFSILATVNGLVKIEVPKDLHTLDIDILW